MQFGAALCQYCDLISVFGTDINRVSRLLHHPTSGQSRKPHRAKSLIVPENIRLLHQPPYTPQVMPVKHLWDDIREKYFYNRVFKSLTAVEDTLCEALNQLNTQLESLRSMTFFSHLKITL